jgi:crotonobetainyl-CoA:carnitine CoA-transferase CaiB-like acyl-CoA transferase
MKKEEFYQEVIPGSKGPLEGVKILEATKAAAGPFAGMLLADLGAESIKIELPGTGDPTRIGIPRVAGTSELDRGTLYLTINRNKKCVTLDLHKPEGQEIFRLLAQNVDVVIQNYKPGTMEGWGLGYKDIRKVKSDIIYTSVSGFGQYGPYHHLPGYDTVGQAMGGIMHINGYPETPPTRTGNAIVDNLTGWQAAFATLAALHCRSKTGAGQHVDVSLLDSALYTTDIGIMAAANADFKWTRNGSSHPVLGNFGRTPPVCKDGYLVMVVTLDSHWARLCRIIGREDLITDPRTCNRILRAQNGDLLNEVIENWTRGKTVKEAVEILNREGIVATPIYDFDQILADEHIQERGMIADVEHPASGKLKLFGVPAKFSKTPGSVRMPSPMLGQHNEEIYRNWLGFSPEKMKKLNTEGII